MRGFIYSVLVLMLFIYLIYSTLAFNEYPSDRSRVLYYSKLYWESSEKSPSEKIKVLKEYYDFLGYNFTVNNSGNNLIVESDGPILRVIPSN